MEHNHYHVYVREGHPLDISQTISLHFAEASGISFQETTAPTVAASTIWLWNTLQAWQGDAASWYLSRAYSEDYERSASKSEVECINATHFLPVPDHQLNELQRETACDPALQFVKKGILGGFPDTKDEQPAAIHQYRISLNNSLGQFISFFAQKGGDYSREGDYLREAIISNIAHWKSCPKYFVLFFH